jgi:guanylate kinase
MYSDKKAGQRKMMVFAAPSGAGKTTIVHHLLNRFDKLAFSISATTREKRDYETEGEDYYFLTEAEFRQRIEKGDFVEWVEVYPGRFYGTLRNEIERLWAQGKCVLFDIDVVGAMQIKKKYGVQCMSVFVQPPSVEVLIDRLRNRKTETEETLNTRRARFLEELAYASRFDRILINDRLEPALEEAEKLTLDFLERDTHQTA